MGSGRALRDVVERSIVLCYKEDASELNECLRAGGLNPTIQRASYTPEQLGFTSAMRTFLNHRAAWEIAARSPGYTLICESDFVPCAGVGSLPTFWPLDDDLAWGYLYQGSPRLLALVGPERYLRGHCAPLVAYAVNARVAGIFLRFFDDQMSQYRPQDYFSFDSHLQWWVMGQGAQAFIPLRHYGEHGGKPNPEHARLGNVPRAGRHRADNLIGPLAFLPQYADGSRTAFWTERIKARFLGWARLLGGRWLAPTNGYAWTARDVARMFAVGLRRLSPSLSRP